MACVEDRFVPNNNGREPHSYRIVRLDETGSTNDDAKQLARAGAPEGTVVVAERQTAGRGRRGRSWITPPGTALTFSVVLRPDIAPTQVPLLVFLAAAAVRQAAEEVLEEAAGGAPGPDVLIKWPNDVVVENRKLCGILVETNADRDQVHWCIVGIGVNVNQQADEFPPDLRQQATSLRQLAGGPVDKDALLSRILSGLASLYETALNDRFAGLLAEVRRWSATLGRSVRVYEADGSWWDGIAEEIRDDGALLVRPDVAFSPARDASGVDSPAPASDASRRSHRATEDGLVAVYAADVSVRRADAPESEHPPLPIVQQHMP